MWRFRRIGRSDMARSLAFPKVRSVSTVFLTRYRLTDANESNIENCKSQIKKDAGDTKDDDRMTACGLTIGCDRENVPALGAQYMRLDVKIADNCN